MASQFIGLHMLVTVGDPPARFRGTVSDVEAGESLTLSNVWALDGDHWQPRLKIKAQDIVDVSEIPAVPAAASAAPSQPAPPHPAPPQPAPPQPAPPQAALPRQSISHGLSDPAILAVRSRPTATDAPDTVTPAAASKDVAATVIEATPVVEGNFEDAQAPQSQKKKRRQKKPANGWRQTPILESTASFQPYNSLKKQGGKGALNDNGWASEDVTDVQEMGDFDFEGGLAKFDKRNLFEQMRREDRVSEADRLVSHNRQPRPKSGTAGGKNLHYTENVLDIPPAVQKSGKERPVKEAHNDFWNSEADDRAPNNGERLSGKELGGRQSSRRGETRAPNSRRSRSRKASAATTGQGQGQGPGQTRANSAVSHQQVCAARNSRLDDRALRGSTDVNKQSGAGATSQGFYLVPSNRRVETVSALQMLNLENIAHTELGLTEDMMAENAARSIADVTLAVLADPAIRVRHAASADPATGHIPPPTVVILAGNNKSGIRAVATGRHLRNKGINVFLCVVGIERGERDLLEDMRQQVRLFRNFGGRILSKIDLFDHLRKTSIPTLTIDTPRTSSLASLTKPAPVTLIIDALLGLAISFEELRTGDQATVYELIEWANRNEAFVLALDVPTGIDPSSGKVSIVDGNQLYVKPRYVVSLGAPKRGLLEALAAADEARSETGPDNGTLPDDIITEWKLFVADVGLGAAVWKKAGTKMRRGISFDYSWILEIKYQGSPPEGQELV